MSGITQEDIIANLFHARKHLLRQFDSTHTKYPEISRALRDNLAGKIMLSGWNPNQADAEKVLARLLVGTTFYSRQIGGLGHMRVLEFHPEGLLRSIVPNVTQDLVFEFIVTEGRWSPVAAQPGIKLMLELEGQSRIYEFVDAITELGIKEPGSSEDYDFTSNASECR